jgi:hypothetical protein
LWDALAVNKRVETLFGDKEGVFLNEINVNVVAQQPGHGHSANTL